MLTRLDEKGPRIMMLDWKAYKDQIRSGFADVGRVSRATIRGYRQLSGAEDGPGVLDEKTRELIALAVGVTRQCDGCIVSHADAALRAGATREEIVEALGVAVAVNAGAALVFSARALDAVSALSTADGEVRS